MLLKGIGVRGRCDSPDESFLPQIWMQLVCLQLGSLLLTVEFLYLQWCLEARSAYSGLTVGAAYF